MVLLKEKMYAAPAHLEEVEDSQNAEGAPTTKSLALFANATAYPNADG